MEDLENKILEAAARRDVYVRMEAKLHGVEESKIVAVIRKLIRQKKLSANRKSKPGFWGSAPSGYRAN